MLTHKNSENEPFENFVLYGILHNIPGFFLTSTLMSLETVPASFVPTQVYVPALAGIALSIVPRDKNGLSEGVTILIPSPEESILPSLSHEIVGEGMPLISHSTSSSAPTTVFGDELKFVINGSAVEEGGQVNMCVCGVQGRS